MTVNPTLTARIYDQLAETLPHVQLRQQTAEHAAGVVADFDTWPIGSDDTDERLINPIAYDAARNVCCAFNAWDEARTESLRASRLVDLCNAISDLTSYLTPEDREELDYGGESPSDRRREIERRKKPEN